MAAAAWMAEAASFGQVASPAGRPRITRPLAPIWTGPGTSPSGGRKSRSDALEGRRKEGRKEGGRVSFWVLLNEACFISPKYGEAPSHLGYDASRDRRERLRRWGNLANLKRASRRVTQYVMLHVRVDIAPPHQQLDSCRRRHQLEASHLGLVQRRRRDRR